MQRPLLALTLLFAAGCASQQAHPRSINVELFEQRGRMANRDSLSGQHAFVIRIQNVSEEAVSIDSIALSSFSNVIELYDADQAVNEVIEPGQTSNFTMWVNVVAKPMNNNYTIDSLDVTVACHSASRGDFTESGSHSVAVLR